MRIDPQALGADCTTCPFAKNGKPHRPVGGEGLEPTALGVLVGEGPGEEEAQTGRPFVGMTGRVLDAELQHVGLPRASLAILNATACQPTIRTPHALKAAVRCCAPAFKAQLARVAPNAPVFAMGTHAVEALGIKAKIKTGRGFIRQIGVVGTAGEWVGRRPAIVTWHPTFAFFRAPPEHGPFSIDLERFARLATGRLHYIPPLVNTAPTADDVMALIAGRTWIAADVEAGPDNPKRPWTGLDPKRARLKTIALGTQERAIATEWGRDAEVDTAIRLVLNTLTSVWANGAWYDHPLLRRYGVKIPKWEDVRDRRRALSATSRLSLLYMTSLYADFHPWKESDDGEKMHARPMAELLLYNGWDTVATARVEEGLLRDVAKEDANEDAETVALQQR